MRAEDVLARLGSTQRMAITLSRKLHYWNRRMTHRNAHPAYVEIAEYSDQFLRVSSYLFRISGDVESITRLPKDARQRRDKADTAILRGALSSILHTQLLAAETVFTLRILALEYSDRRKKDRSLSKSVARLAKRVDELSSADYP